VKTIRIINRNVVIPSSFTVVNLWIIPKQKCTTDKLLLHSWQNLADFLRLPVTNDSEIINGKNISPLSVLKQLDTVNFKSATESTVENAEV
jgi:hypothetical protein